MLGHRGGSKFFRILADHRLELGDRPAGREQRTADVNLARVDLHVKSQRMPKLIDAARTPGDEILDRVPHCANFTVKKIHVMPSNLEPSTTVHGRSPRAERRYQSRRMTIVQFLRSRFQSHCREGTLGVVVNPQIDIGALVGGPPRPRTAKHNRHDTFDVRDAGNNLADYFVDFALSGHASSISRTTKSSNEHGPDLNSSCWPTYRRLPARRASSRPPRRATPAISRFACRAADGSKTDSRRIPRCRRADPRADSR